MAKKATEGAPPDGFNRAAALAQKHQQIKDMARLAEQRGCFRQTLIGYFAGSGKASRRSFSMWLLEWVFAEPAIRGKKVACCDACSRRLIKRRGELGYVQEVLANRS